MRALISDFSRVGGMVVDMCARHCITAVAAELQCRKFVCVEICPVAYGRAVSRFREQCVCALQSFILPVDLKMRGRCICESLKRTPPGHAAAAGTLRQVHLLEAVRT